MTSVSVPVQPTSRGRIRPINVLRDLPKVADLIELCFANSMDSEGQSYVQQMRRAGRDASFMRWANHAIESASMPLSGYVWEEDGHIVGNASLVPFRHKGKRIYLIANVATHPEHRRMGIARALTEKAIQHARQRNSTDLWLHVREDNPGAVKMYTDLGFSERARRTTWHKQPNTPLSRMPEPVTVTKRNPRFWPQQQAWLDKLHPDDLGWYRSWNWNALKPGLWNWLYRVFVEFDIRQWAALKNGQLQGVLASMPSPRSDLIWLAHPPQADPETITALLERSRRELGAQRRLTLEHPAGVLTDAITAAGFRLVRTLIWMHAPGATS